MDPESDNKGDDDDDDDVTGHDIISIYQEETENPQPGSSASETKKSGIQVNLKEVTKGTFD